MFIFSYLKKVKTATGTACFYLFYKVSLAKAVNSKLVTTELFAKRLNNR